MRDHVRGSFEENMPYRSEVISIWGYSRLYTHTTIEVAALAGNQVEPTTAPTSESELSNTEDSSVNVTAFF